MSYHLHQTLLYYFLPPGILILSPASSILITCTKGFLTPTKCSYHLHQLFQIPTKSPHHQERRVGAVVRHPEFRSSEHYFNFALLFLEEEFIRYFRYKDYRYFARHIKYWSTKDKGLLHRRGSLKPLLSSSWFQTSRAFANYLVPSSGAHPLFSPMFASTPPRLQIIEIIYLVTGAKYINTINNINICKYAHRFHQGKAYRGHLLAEPFLSCFFLTLKILKDKPPPGQSISRPSACRVLAPTSRLATSVLPVATARMPLATREGEVFINL